MAEDRAGWSSKWHEHIFQATNKTWWCRTYAVTPKSVRQCCFVDSFVRVNEQLLYEVFCVFTCLPCYIIRVQAQFDFRDILV